MEQTDEGSILIIRHPDNTVPGREAYRMVFRRDAGGGEPSPVRDVIGVDELAEVLRLGIGMRPQEVKEALEQASRGELTIPHVRVTRERREFLRL